MSRSSCFRRTVVLAALIVVAGTLAGAAAASAAAVRLVALPRGSAYELQLDGDGQRLRVPLDPARGVTTSRLRVTLLSVTLDRRDDPALAQSFDVSLTAGRGRRGPALLIDVADVPALVPGSYALLLRVTSARRVRSGRGRRRRTVTQRRRQLATVRLTVPAATLRSLEVLRVERTKGVLGFDEETRSALLVLRETSRRSGLSEITLSPLASARGSRLSGATLRGPMTLSPLVAGGRAEVAYAIDGEFDLGTTTGVLEVDAPQLAAPLQVPFEVVVRRTPWLIPLIALLGALLGWLTRSVAVSLASWATARRGAQALLEELETLRAAHRDEVFLAATAPLVASLESLLGRPAPDTGFWRRRAQQLRAAVDRDERTAAIDRAVGATRRALAVALRQLDADRAEVTKAVAQWRALRRANLRLPEQLHEQLRRLDAAIATAERALPGDDLTAARRALDTIREEIVPLLRERGEPLLRELLDLLTALRALRLPAQVRADVERLHAELRKLAPAARHSDEAVAEARSLLASLDGAQQTRMELLDALLPRLAGEVSAAAAQVAPWPGAGPQPPRLADAAAAELMRATRDARRGSGPLDAIADAAELAIEQLLFAIEGHPHIADDGELRERARELFDAGDYAAAARLTHADQLRHDAGFALLSFDRQPFAAPPLPTVGLAQPVWPLAERGTGAAPTRSPLETSRFVTTLAFAQAGLLRVLAVFVFVAIAAYGAFQAQWIGTTDQIIAVFLWGYGLDLGTQSLVTLAQGARPAPAPPPAAPVAPQPAPAP